MTAPPPGLPPRILIVDDTPAHLSLLVDALHAAGLRPLVANGGEVALARLAQIQPDLILLDMRMPGLSGMETMERLRATPAGREIPVIFMTAVEEPEQKLAAFSAGAVDYVTKPFHPEEVLARVCTHLRLRALQQALEQELAWRAETERTLQGSLEQGIIVAARDGRIQFCTHRASQLLTRYFPEAPNDSLPAALWPTPPGSVEAPFRRDGVQGELLVRLVADPSGDAPIMLLCEERRQPGDYAPLRSLGLSEREAEVLYWISHGKTNPEIALIIGAAAGTVKKHAENLFAKLGVENRTAAMRIALDHLSRPDPTPSPVGP